MEGNGIWTCFSYSLQNSNGPDDGPLVCVGWSLTCEEGGEACDCNLVCLDESGPRGGWHYRVTSMLIQY